MLVPNCVCDFICCVRGGIETDLLDPVMPDPRVLPRAERPVADEDPRLPRPAGSPDTRPRALELTNRYGICQRVRFEELSRELLHCLLQYPCRARSLAHS